LAFKKKVAGSIGTLPHGAKCRVDIYLSFNWEPTELLRKPHCLAIKNLGLKDASLFAKPTAMEGEKWSVS
jgi:hypothetical protein